MSERHPRVLAIDAGGTMTDTFIVDASGQLIVGKAQTTPEDEAVGFMRSAEDALDYWNLEPSSAFPQIVSGIYSGTAMLNRLLERKGRKVGCIVSGGLEDYFKLERIDLFGDVAIPLYEDDVRAAAAALLDQGVESIVVNLLYSWRNPVHEQRVRELVEEVCAERGLNGG